jgi:hypothetical protein
MHGVDLEVRADARVYVFVHRRRLRDCKSLLKEGEIIRDLPSKDVKRDFAWQVINNAAGYRPMVVNLLTSLSLTGMDNCRLVVIAVTI